MAARSAGLDMQARDVRSESAALVTNWGWGGLFDGCVGCVYGSGRYRRGSCHLPHYLPRIRRGLRAIEITPVNKSRARELKNHEQK